MSLRLFYNMLVSPIGSGEGEPEEPPDPAGAPSDLNAPNDGTNYSIAWTDAAAQDVELHQDDSYYATISAGVQIKAIGAMYGDGTHEWKARHIDPVSDFSTPITTIDGIVGGGGGPSADPSALNAYEYAGGAKFGIQWTNGDATASTSVEMDSIQVSLAAAGETTYDVGYKAIHGTHTWRCRHWKNGVYSDYSATISTTDGVEV